jgi:S1-C subfamily serine protease
MVASVEADSPAAKAGLKGLSNAIVRGVTNLGDIVTAVD